MNDLLKPHNQGCSSDASPDFRLLIQPIHIDFALRIRSCCQVVPGRDVNFFVAYNWRTEFDPVTGLIL
jgi:hypothetical protein